jgi:hypothetical protein
MMDQIKALRVAVEHIPQCQSATMHWMLVVPLLANQTFEGVATALCQAAENLGEPTTASMAGYANAAYQIPFTPPDPNPWTAMAALMTAHMAHTQTTLHALAAALTEGGGHNKSARSNPKTASAHAPARHRGATTNTAGPMANAPMSPPSVRTLCRATRSLPHASSAWEDADGNGMTGMWRSKPISSFMRAEIVDIFAKLFVVNN